VDDLDERVPRVRQRVVGAGDAEGGGARGATLGRAAQNAANLHTDAPERLDVDGADETRADDGRADVGDPSHVLAHPLLTG
jgi:hypothetical protein